MSNILIVSESISPTVQMLTEGIELLCAQYRQNSVRTISTVTVKNNDILWSDVIISVRSLSKLDTGIARIVKKYDRFHILMLDDDFLGIDKSYSMMPERLEQLKEILKYTDLILTDNILLAEKYLKLADGKRYALSDTLVRPESIITRDFGADNNSKVKILFYVNDGTCGMFNKYILPIMPSLCDIYADRVSLTLISLKPDLKAYESKMEINYIDHICYADFKKLLAEEKYDIGIAPIDNGGFSQYKYFNKFFEYSKAGIAGIYSNCPPYTFIIKDGYNGVLCGDKPNDWLQALGKLICNEELRKVIVCNAQKQLREEFCEEVILTKLTQQIPELVTYSAPKDVRVQGVMPLKLYHKVFILREYIHFTILHIREEGIFRFIKRAIRYLKRR